MNSNELIRLTPAPARAADWIDALAHHAVLIGKWPAKGEDFWARLANLAFHAALLNRLCAPDGEENPRWHGTLSATESFAVDHLAMRLLESGFTTTDDKDRPDIDIEATKAVWRAAWTGLPGLCGAPATHIGDRRGRWFMHIAAACAESIAAQGAVKPEACDNRYRKLDRENRFLASRIFAWNWPAGPREDLRSSGEEFIHYLYPSGGATATVYRHILRTEPRLHSGPLINWSFETWLQVGWNYGHRFNEKTAKEHVPRMVAEGPEQDLAFTYKLLAQLEASAPDGVTWSHLGRACVAYIKEIHGLVSDGHGPMVCVHALDYGFFMALGLRGLLPPCPPAPPAEVVAPVSGGSETPASTAP
jgi:hypothetical protein